MRKRAAERESEKNSHLGRFLYRLLIFKRGSRATVENLVALDERIEQMRAKIREIEKSKVLEENTGQAIVTFNYEVSASACVADHISDVEEWFVRKLRKEPDAPKFRGTTAIVVERAPEPSDIIWRNMGFNTKGGNDDGSHNSLLRNRHVHAFFIMTGSLVAFLPRAMVRRTVEDANKVGHSQEKRLERRRSINLRCRPERLASAENHVRVDHFDHQRHLDANREGSQPLRALQIALPWRTRCYWEN